MGEDKNRHFRVSFTDKLKVYFKGSEVTSDGGLIAVRPACLPVRQAGRQAGNLMSNWNSRLWLKNFYLTPDMEEIFNTSCPNS